ncbi:MAG TPA: class I SAM-dependent methyltransferase [Gaiellaceae bacterium]|nr:class I SAM-dependent methyltransferase [Gaiellaceae bacterium]
MEGVAAQTWHHGLVARWWAEFNDDFRPHELPYFRRRIEQDGRPALDAGCGTGRLLRPLLRAGLDVDGCDVSADMVAACREKAAQEGLAPTLFVQPLHALDPPRRYGTVVVCGTFGLGSTRAQDVEALDRLHACLEPGGTLLLDVEVPYADAPQWRRWTKEGRADLPEPPRAAPQRRPAPDGNEYSLGVRLLDLDPLGQRVTLGMHAEQWREGELQAEEDHLLTINLYFAEELRLLLERAGFVDVVVEGDHNDRPATSDDDFLVFVARTR